MSNYSIIQPQNSIPEYQPLPKEVVLPEELGDAACPWLDEYKIFAKKWSPRSYEGYHEILGISILSITAARRLSFYFGRERFTNLFISLTGRSSLPAKSTANNIAKTVIYKAGLSPLMLPQTCTPQKLINEMKGSLPKNFDELPQEKQDFLKLQIAFAGQRGWIYDEFGTLLSQIIRPNGPMADFRGILRVFDDGEDEYSYATINRGLEIVYRPYLSLISILTITDVIPFGKKGSSMWGDGFFARFIFVLPDLDFFQNGRFPNEIRVTPSSLTQPLKEFHQWLGVPEVKINNGEASVAPLSPKTLRISNDVVNAYYAYDEAIISIIANSTYLDLDGNYARLPEKALRIAALFAGFQRKDTIEMVHWARAQYIAESFRKDLHKLIHQIDVVSQAELSFDNRVKEIILRKGSPTAREINQYTKISYPDIESTLVRLIQRNEVRKIDTNHTCRYELNF